MTTGADLTEIQNAVSGILDQHGILVAAGPLGAGLIGRLITKNKVIRLGAIAYVDFLESGRAMVLMQGLTQEKQNISLDIDDARKLRALLDADVLKPALR